jgi:prevent-host-death family protein
MAITTLSSREFNQRTSEAKKAAENGPVFITDRGRTAHVLITFEDYEKLAGKRGSILDRLEIPEDQDFEFDPPRMGDSIFRPVDFE